MSKQDYYESLNVTKNADASSLKSAYRKLAMQYHPDKNPGDAKAEAKFKEINEAYEILKDDNKRAAYDQYGHQAFEGGMGGRQSGGQGFGGFTDIFEEMFGDFGGGGRGHSAAQANRGSDQRYNLEISLEDAFHGKNIDLKIPGTVSCEKCDGSGAEDDAKPISCATCNGHGKVRQQQGFFTLERVCPACQGQGSSIDKPCNPCSGSGRVTKERTLSVNIPKGVEEGTRIRLTGEGEAGLRGATAGDLYIFISVSPHKIFQRDGANIFCEVPIVMADAALGAEIEVPTIDGGRAKVKIPNGSQTSQQFRLRAKGMNVMRSNSRGDMYIQISVETPVNLTKRQKELLEEFRNAGDNNKSHSPKSDGFFSKVKEFWEDLTE